MIKEKAFLKLKIYGIKKKKVIYENFIFDSMVLKTFIQKFLI